MLLKTIIAFLLLGLFGCTPAIHPAGPEVQSKALYSNAFLTEDGTRLPLLSWPSRNGEPKAVIIALHGFNDYSLFFDAPGLYFMNHGITSYAYDQRGFGRAPNRKLWAGIETYVDDLQTLTALVRSKHPGKPVYWLGESMGGAVALVAATRSGEEIADGLILAAPAIWAREIMPWYQQTLLWSLSHTVPWLNLTGEGMGVVASDNTEMLRAMGRDPLVIKESRVESIYGLANLMDAAAKSAPLVNVPVLMLYGEKDDLIPFEPTLQFVNELLSHDAHQKLVACYENGYHLLLRDLQAEILWNDIDSWVSGARYSLPSAAERHRNCFDETLKKDRLAQEYKDYESQEDAEKLAAEKTESEKEPCKECEDEK